MAIFVDLLLVNSVGQQLPEWQCQHCTYINSTSEGSCDMCTLPRFS